MPDSPEMPLSNVELHRRALASGYQINVLPQPHRASFGSGETNQIVDTESAWQWNVRYRSSRTLSSGHSCASPHMAFEQALASLREIVPNPAPQPPTWSDPRPTVAEPLAPWEIELLGEPPTWTRGI